MNDYSYDKENNESYQNFGNSTKSKKQDQNRLKSPFENKFNGKEDLNDLYSASPGGNYSNMYMMKRKKEGYGARYGAKKASKGRRSMSRAKGRSRNASRGSYGHKRTTSDPASNNFIFNQIKNEAIKHVHARR